MMKLSNYNFFYYDFDSGHGKDNYLLYNSRTNALAVLEKENYDILKNYEDGQVDNLDKEFLSNLKDGGYVVEDHINELELLRHRLLSNRYSQQGFGLTIAPTLNCNFDCTYCYEKNSNKSAVMSEEVKRKIVELVQQKVEVIKSFDVTWYGGEPTLALDTIYELSQNFIELCDEKKVRYSAGLITNGYKLTRAVAEELKKISYYFFCKSR